MVGAHRKSFDSSIPALHFAPPPPPPSQPSNSGRMSDVTFDSNLVVILAALLCALVCALGLNSIFRCALRCSRRMVFESADDAAVRLANTGLTKKAMAALPTVTYSVAALPAEVSTDCPICLSEFTPGECLKVLPKCNHGFHVGCIDTWLASHSSCPTCRFCLLDAPSSKPSISVRIVVEPPLPFHNSHNAWP